MTDDFFKEIENDRDGTRTGDPSLRLSRITDRLKKLGAAMPPTDLLKFIPYFLNSLGIKKGGSGFVPQILLDLLPRILLRSHSVDTVCDPWAGFGSLLALVQFTTGAKTAIGFTASEREAGLGSVFGSYAQLRVGDPLQLLSELSGDVDVVVSVLPFGYHQDTPLLMKTETGECVELKADLGGQLLVAASEKLSIHGIGLFVVPPSFFISRRSVLSHFTALGLGIDAALALPPGAFAPYFSIPTYLVIIKKQPFSRMFVAQLSNTLETNELIISNYEQTKEGGTCELGRFVDPLSFTGLEILRAIERFQEAQQRTGGPLITLEQLSPSIRLGRTVQDSKFPEAANAIFVPLIGTLDVVDSSQDLSSTPQNYAQVVIDADRSDARFVARFLNSETGRELREGMRTGAGISKLNPHTLKQIPVIVPDLKTQASMLEIETRITEEQNTLFGLQNELVELRRQLWTDTATSVNVKQALDTLSGRLAGNLKQQAVDQLDQWFETLPFPLASILRTWRATSTQDLRAKYEHLLHFFEACAEFLSVVLLSAFGSNEALFQTHKQKLRDTLADQKLSFERTTFGTWKVVVEYLSKQTRLLLSASGKRPEVAKNEAAMCAEMFSDPSLDLPKTLSRKELIPILSTTNKMRNDWLGHGGVVTRELARLRHEQLLGELQRLRHVMVDMWTETQLICALNCRPRRGVFENEISVLMGSNSEFLKETRAMSTYLVLEELYLSRKDAPGALRLLPLIEVGASPQSAKNACYFFNRVEKDGLRFIAYHFTEQPEHKTAFADASELMKFLGESCA